LVGQALSPANRFFLGTAEHAEEDAEKAKIKSKPEITEEAEMPVCIVYVIVFRASNRLWGSNRASAG